MSRSFWTRSPPRPDDVASQVPMSEADLGDKRFENALECFGASHHEDPRSIEVDGIQVPWSSHYHARLLHWVLELDGAASIPLRLAAACQHVRRWEVPRSDYDEGRRGYRSWRSDLAQMHAGIAREVLEEVGYDEETIGRVDQLIRKLGLGRDPEVQLFEDAICMVFFENEFRRSRLQARRREDGRYPQPHVGQDVTSRTRESPRPRVRSAGAGARALGDCDRGLGHQPM